MKTLDEYVERTIENLRRKLDNVTRVFRDIILYSNKTYFLEEIYRQKMDNDQLRRLITNLRMRLEFAEIKAGQASDSVLPEMESSLDSI